MGKVYNLHLYKSVNYNADMITFTRSFLRVNCYLFCFFKYRASDNSILTLYMTKGESKIFKIIYSSVV